MKKVITISLIVVGIILFLFAVFKKNDMYIDFIPKPDKLLLYYKEEIIELEANSSYYDRINNLINDRFHNRIYISETSISLDDVKDIKENIAIEYVFFEENAIALNEATRNYSKILFPLDEVFGEHMIFYYDSEYKSGPISNLKESRKLNETIKILFK